MQTAQRPWWHAPLDAGRALLRPRGEPAGAGIVPIRSLGASQRPRILAHLLALGPEDRYLRFGYAASDGQIRHYVAQLDFARDEVFGIVNRRLDLVAVAHLALGAAADEPAEFGVSVARTARGRGLGARLFAHAVLLARNAGVRELFIHALTQNVAMLRIARRAGATVEGHGAESDARLQLPPADFDSRLQQLVQGRIGALDYDLKRQARQWRGVLGDLQEVRQGVRVSRHGTGQ